MACFAFKVSAIRTPQTRFNPDWDSGMLETSIVASLFPELDDVCHRLGQSSCSRPWRELDDSITRRVVALGDDCSRTLVWHTKSQIPEWWSDGTTTAQILA